MPVDAEPRGLGRNAEGVAPAGTGPISEEADKHKCPTKIRQKSHLPSEE
jgi:hypothetical protein